MKVVFPVDVPRSRLCLRCVPRSSVLSGLASRASDMIAQALACMIKWIAMRSRWRRAVLLAKAIRPLDNLVRYNPLFYSRIRSLIRGLSGCTDDPECRSARERLLSRALERARRTPYGKGRPAALEGWPVLTKDLVKNDPSAFLCPSRLRIPAATGGSSGVPMTLQRSLLNVTAEQAFIDSLLEPHRITFKDSRVAVLRGDVVKSPNDADPPYGVLRGSRYFILSAYHLSADTVDWYVDALAEYEPDLLWIYPTAGRLLAELVEASSAELRIPVVLSSSEMLTDSSWKRFRSVFGAAVIDYYGQAERVCMAYRRSVDEWWFLPSYGYVELLRIEPVEETQVRQGDEQLARVVATGFWNSRMPLVRYDTGDLIAYPSTYSDRDLEKIARGGLPFSRVVGRESEYLVTPSGKRIHALNNIPRDVPHVRQAQFIQKSRDCVEIRVLTGADFSNRDSDELLQNARQRIPEEVNIELILTEQLQRTPSGKTPFLIRECS
jgi:phenylacetate-CoA ligase